MPSLVPAASTPPIQPNKAAAGTFGCQVRSDSSFKYADAINGAKLPRPSDVPGMLLESCTHSAHTYSTIEVSAERAHNKLPSRGAIPASPFVKAAQLT